MLRFLIFLVSFIFISLQPLQASEVTQGSSGRSGVSCSIEYKASNGDYIKTQKSLIRSAPRLELRHERMDLALSASECDIANESIKVMVNNRLSQEGIGLKVIRLLKATAVEAYEVSQ